MYARSCLVHYYSAAAAAVAEVWWTNAGYHKEYAVTSVPPFSGDLSEEPPTTGSRHQKCLVAFTHFQNIPGTSVPECAAAAVVC